MLNNTRAHHSSLALLTKGSLAEVYRINVNFEFWGRTEHCRTAYFGMVWLHANAPARTTFVPLMFVTLILKALVKFDSVKGVRL